VSRKGKVIDDAATATSATKLIQPKAQSVATADGHEERHVDKKPQLLVKVKHPGEGKAPASIGDRPKMARAPGPAISSNDVQIRRLEERVRW